MLYVLLLCGGVGKRLNKDIYMKPMNTVYGMPMIYWNIKSLRLEEMGVPYQLIVSYNYVLETCNFTNSVRNMFPDINMRFVRIDYLTRGAAETLFLTLNAIRGASADDVFLIVDNDVLVEDTTVLKRAASAQHHFVVSKHIEEPNPAFSYVQVAEGRVTAIKEKCAISNEYCVGLYGFVNAPRIKEIILDLTDKAEKQNNEYYVSSIYQRLLSAGERVDNIPVTDVRCMGTYADIVANRDAFHKTLRFCFDLDNTLVTFPATPGDYTTCRPIEDKVRFVRRLHGEGHTIIIHTARRMKTHKSNAGAVVQDIGLLTLQQLKEFDIPYDEIYFGKPHADFYVDDRGVNPYEPNFYERFGFIYNTSDPVVNKLPNNCYNTITRHDDKITKLGRHPYIDGEIFFYKTISSIPELSGLFPTYHASQGTSLTIEYLHSIPLTKLYTNGTLTESVVNKALDILDRLHSQPIIERLTDEQYAMNYAPKLRSRFNPSDYPFEGAENVLQKLCCFLDEYAARRMPANIVGAVHGDYWMSNILLTYTDQIKLIDMKGCVGTMLTITGDKMYDYCKLYQSVIGYDHAVNDAEEDTPYMKKINEHFMREMEKRGVLSRDLRIITASLMFGSIPFNKDFSKRSQARVWELVTRLAE